MRVGCRKCRELLSIIAIKHNIDFIYALLIGAHTENLLDSPYHPCEKDSMSNGI
jgi:hypothetical protein